MFSFVLLIPLIVFICIYYSFESLDTKLDSNGAFTLTYPELEPHSTISFNITVKPKLSGLYESTRARVKYYTGFNYEGGEDEAIQGYSTSLGRIQILSYDENNMLNSYFIKEWFVFFIAFVVVAIYPLYRYTTVKASNLSLTKKRKGGGGGGGGQWYVRV